MSTLTLRGATSGRPIILDDIRPVGTGGEARVLTVQGSPDVVAKIYHPQFVTQTRRKKLELMLRLPPKGAGAVGVAWPQELLVDGHGAVVGYTMPRVTGAELLHTISDPITRLRVAPSITPRFLLRAVRNLAAAVEAVHAAGHLVGDMNAANVYVASSGAVTLVDSDSFEVQGHGERFVCQTGIPELQSPEISRALQAGATFATIQRTTASDVWILGLLAFATLTDGEDPTQPHQASALPDFLGRHTLPEAVVHLVERTLRTPAQRPTAREWRKGAEAALQQLVPCAAKGERHAHSRNLTTCPYCVRAKALRGLDTFSGVPLPPPAAMGPTAVPPIPVPPTPPPVVVPATPTPVAQALPTASGGRRHAPGSGRAALLLAFAWGSNSVAALGDWRLLLWLGAAFLALRALRTPGTHWRVGPALVLLLAGAHLLTRDWRGIGRRAASAPVTRTVAWALLPSVTASRMLGPSPEVVGAQDLARAGDTTAAMAALRAGWEQHRDARALLVAGHLLVAQGRQWTLASRLLAESVERHVGDSYLAPAELAEALDDLARARCALGDRAAAMRFSVRARAMRQVPTPNGRVAGSCQPARVPQKSKRSDQDQAVDSPPPRVSTG